MTKSSRLILLLCIAAVCGVLVLQGTWIVEYYQVNKERFEKEANLAFEDAVKTEFGKRCDTLENLLYRFTTDTSQILISSKWNKLNNRYVYTISNRKHPDDDHSFSLKYLNRPIGSPLDPVARQVARHYVQTYREEDLDRHLIYFHTQNLGNFIGSQAEIYRFDTARLRPIYASLLRQRGITEPFTFLMRDADSTTNSSLFPDSLRDAYPVITKAFPTYKVVPGENYVRALFHTQASYLSSRMTGIVFTSGLLASIVGLALFYLLQTIRRQEKLSEIRNDFIGNISHEFKTPIATVTAAVDALESFGALEDPVKAKRYLSISRNELQRLSGMVSKILELSLYEREDPGLKLEKVHVDSMVETLISNYSIAQPKKISFHYQNSAGTTTIQADPLHLYNVLSNLLDNAIKYSGDAVAIHLSFTREKDQHVIRIKDDGFGIPGQDLPFVFDKFYRVPAGNIHRVKGYGLGLSYVKYIMEKHGGWCLAQSSPGQGSIFTIGLRI